MRIEDIRVGDIITYRHKGINMVNKPHKYCQWYGDDFKHKKWGTAPPFRMKTYPDCDRLSS